MDIGINLWRHVWSDKKHAPELREDLALLLYRVALAAKAIAAELARAALAGKLGVAGEINPTGDVQKKLDLLSHDIFVDAFAKTSLVATIVSEESDEPRPVPGGGEGKFILCTDPLDGSSNTEINGSLGTVFGIYRRHHEGRHIGANEVLRKGVEQIAAGYVLYGPSTLLVYTSGSGVNGFTLDPILGEFILSHPHLRCPSRGKYFSANLGRYSYWPAAVRKYADNILGGAPPGGQLLSLRYTGALVADLHRCLVSGGIFFYPGDRENKDGKLRLVYECAPLAFVAEQAGARATTGSHRILEIKPGNIHQRCPLVIGSVEDVATYERFFAEDIRGL